MLKQIVKALIKSKEVSVIDHQPGNQRSRTNNLLVVAWVSLEVGATCKHFNSCRSLAISKVRYIVSNLYDKRSYKQSSRLLLTMFIRDMLEHLLY